MTTLSFGDVVTDDAELLRLTRELDLCKSALDSTPDLVCVIDANARLRYMNRARQVLISTPRRRVSGLLRRLEPQR